jgi:hypothetical protein
MNPFVRFDAWQIDSIEKYCHRFQRLTGKTNYFFLKLICGLFSFLSFAVICSIYLFPEGSLANITKDNRLFLPLTVLILLYVLTLTVWGANHMEKNAFARIAKKQANPAKSASSVYFLIRWLIWAHALVPVIALFPAIFMHFEDVSGLFFVGIYLTVNTLMCGLFLLGIILFSCDPLPPCDGKIKEWVMGLFYKPVKI